MPGPSHRPLEAAALLALVALAATALLPAGSPLRVALALPLALTLPGYATSSALLPQRLGVAERVAVTVGLSLAMASLGGVALNLTPWGLRPLPWAALLAAITVGTTVVASTRPGGAAPIMARWVWPIGWREALFGSMAAALTVGAFLIAHASATHRSAGFTQLWLLPDGGGTTTVRLGLRSEELSAVTYRLTVAEGGQTLAQWPAITLAPGGTWGQQVALPSGGGPVVADLYRAGTATPYRHVELAAGGRL